MSKEYIASVLKRLRTESGLTADEVGEKVGKSGKTVNGWENARSQPDAEILLQLCDIYNVKDIMYEFRELKNDIAQDNFSLSAHEKTVVIAYRSKPEMQPAVDKLLGIDAKVSTEIIKIAARNGSFTETTITSDDIEGINNLPDVDDI